MEQESRIRRLRRQRSQGKLRPPETRLVIDETAVLDDEQYAHGYAGLEAFAWEQGRTVACWDGRRYRWCDGRDGSCECGGDEETEEGEWDGDGEGWGRAVREVGVL